MPNDKDLWFVRERSKALAALLLTAKDDVHVRSERDEDDGVGLFVEIQRGDALSTRVFVVQVKGTLSSDRSQWTKSVSQLFQVGPESVYLPVCVVVVNVRDNKAYYAWLAEPVIQEENAKLRFRSLADFDELNAEAVDQIINRVNAWYDVLPQQLTPTSS